MSNEEHIFFKKDDNRFSQKLNKYVYDSISVSQLSQSRKLLWIKLIIYLFLFTSSISILFLNPYGKSLFALIINYASISIFGTLLGFNSSHDACHGTFSKKAWVNNLIFHFTFNLQGISARLWRIRHLASHHLFSNVDGCDADIDDNPLLRFSPHHPKKWYMKYQHIYAPFLYSLYLPVWIFAKDFVYLNKKNLANLKNQNYPFWYTIELILVKLIYFGYIVFLPFYFLEFSFSQILLSYSIMLVIGSNIFIYTLITTHFTLETEFPITDKYGFLPYNFSQHQLMTSMDYHPKSQIATFIFGGFNCHAAHHLFPNFPHTIYPIITPVIEKAAAEHKYRYNVLSLVNAIKSHFLFLRKLGA
ncbi:MAG: Uncharacterised protein [Owenweeksia sp. TMED14]|nr:MAG: Uncharacterised protein [Owenweeksia sp. TMED14]